MQQTHSRKARTRHPCEFVADQLPRHVAQDRHETPPRQHIRHHGTFSYVDATLADGTMLKLCLLRHACAASQWQFAIYRASHDEYDESVFPPGLPVGTCQDASTPPVASISTTPSPDSTPDELTGETELSR